MKLKDVLDMEEYLENRCYCSGEIYSSDGFFYQIFKAETECKLLGENDDYFVVIAEPFIYGKEKPTTPQAQLVIIYKSKDNRVADTVRFDATENNIELFSKILKGVSTKILHAEGKQLNEYVEGETLKSLEKVFSIADAIMISDK
jgi:hypothetical protein